MCQTPTCTQQKSSCAYYKVEALSFKQFWSRMYVVWGGGKFSHVGR